MTDLQIFAYGPCWAVTHGRTFLAFAVNQLFADDLVERLKAHPIEQWGNLIPCPFMPCCVSSVQTHDGMVVLAGADHQGWPVCMPMTQAEWDAFERRHPERTMPFSCRTDPVSGLPELCWGVTQMPVQTQTKAVPTLFDQGAAL
jgi:hypothetical protein